MADGTYARQQPVVEKSPFNCQASLYETYRKRAVFVEKTKPSAFTPHVPKKKEKE
jgi:hypothetical protein